MDKKRQTQEKILDAALGEFAEKGFDAASTNAIFPKAGVSKGIVFKYYPTKNDLFLAVFERELNRLRSGADALDLMEKRDPFEKIAALIAWKIEFAKRCPEATKLLADGIARPPKGLEKRILEPLWILGNLSIERFFGDLPMDRIRKEYTKEDVFRHLRIAAAGLQAMYVDNHPEFPYSETARAECLTYLKSVYRGMEIDDGQRV